MSVIMGAWKLRDQTTGEVRAWFQKLPDAIRLWMGDEASEEPVRGKLVVGDVDMAWVLPFEDGRVRGLFRLFSDAVAFRDEFAPGEPIHYVNVAQLVPGKDRATLPVLTQVA
jgi:hypothetical protein